MKQKKYTYNIISNTKFVVQTVSNVGKSILPLHFFLIPIGVMIPTLKSYIPKILLDLVEKNSLSHVMIIVVFGLTAVTMIASCLQNKLTYLSDLNMKKVSRKLDLLFSEKVMTMPFELLEGPVGRNAYQKAKNSLDRYGSYSFLSHMFSLVKNVCGIIIYSTIISRVNFFIVPIIIGTQALGGVFAALIRQKENKLKKPKAIVDRKLNYISNSAKSFSAAKDIRLYSMQSFFEKMSIGFLAQKKEIVRKGQSYYIQNNIFASFIVAMITAGTYIYLVCNLFQENISAADIVLYVGIITGFASWIEKAADSFDSLMRANHAISDVRVFLDLGEDNQKKYSYGEIAQDFSKDWIIELDNVSYKYAGSDTFAIKNVNLQLKSGEKVAIVGYNGAGKSTLIKLLCGLYNPTYGAIKVNGKNINEYNDRYIFSLFSSVFQEVRVLPERILDNITGSKVDVDFSRVEDTIDDVGLREKILSLEKGLYTLLMKNVNSDAIELSGGEEQKLVMARALYKDAPLVVLDEPTAALDPIAENDLYLKYNKLVEGKTSIFISHRLSSTKFCDKILMIENGEIVESGSHIELMKKAGKYAELYKIQSQYYEENFSKKEGLK